MIELDYRKPPSALRYMAGAFSSRVGDAFPPLIARLHRHRIDRASLARFHELTGLPHRGVLSPIVPLVFGFRLHMAILTDRSFPVPIWRVLQTRNAFRVHREIPEDAQLDFMTSIATHRAVEKGAEVDLHTKVHVAGELCWESDITFLVRGAKSDRREELAPSPRPPETEHARFMMRTGHGREFGAFTGDYNGIHLWDAYARRFGFRRALYHPSRVLAECLARLPEVRELSAWLKGPVFYGADVSLRLDSAGVFAVITGDDPRPSLVGTIASRRESGE